MVQLGGMEPRWLAWARRVQALAQSGLHYATSPFDIQRYEELRHIAAEMMASYSHAEWEDVERLFAEQNGYATPKVDVRGVVFREGEILLVQEKVDGKWTLPGGWADVGDTPSHAAVREIWEESGFRTRPVKLLALWDRTQQGHEPPGPFDIYKVFIQCELTGGEATTSMETTAVGFFGPHAIPELSLARVTPRQIERMFEHRLHPEWPADFD